MDYRLNISAQNYLDEFDEILLNMSNKMLNPSLGNSVTINFIRCMIPHHEAAIYMCQNLLGYNIDPRLRLVAENIIKEQSEGVQDLYEIRQMLLL